MNILYLINYAGNGGSEKYVRVISQAMKAKGVSVYLGYNETGPLVAHMSPAYQITMRHPFDFKATKALARLCNQLEIDLIHAQFPRENYIALLSNFFSKKKWAVVYTSHINLKIGRLHKTINWVLTRRNAAIIAVCHAVSALLIKNRYPAQKIHVIYNGVVHEARVPVEKEDCFTFVTLARLSEEKGLPFLLESAKQLRDNGADFQLKIAGEGELKPQLQAYIDTHQLQDQVFLLGHVADTQALLATSHAYVNSSVHEALSFGILEAMSMGLPLIATEVGGNVDIIQEAQNGILIDYGDTVQMSQAMERMMNNPELYQRYGENSVTAVKTTFNLQKIIDETYEVYKNAR